MPGNGPEPGRTERLAPAGVPTGVPEPVLAAPAPTARSEWSTWAVLVAVYGGWLALTFHSAALPLVGGAGGRRVAHGVARILAARGHPRLSDPLRPGERGARLASGRALDALRHLPGDPHGSP